MYHVKEKQTDTPPFEGCLAPEEDEENLLTLVEQTNFTHHRGGCGFDGYYEMDTCNL